MAAVGATVSHEDDVSALHDALVGRVVDTVALAVGSVPDQQPLFHYLEFELLGVRLDVHKGPGADDSKKTQVRLRAV